MRPGGFRHQQNEGADRSIIHDSNKPISKAPARVRRRFFRYQNGMVNAKKRPQHGVVQDSKSRRVSLVAAEGLEPPTHGL